MLQEYIQSPPQNIDAEEAILGGVLLDPEAITRVCDSLNPQHFYVREHQLIYQAAISLHAQNRTVDLMTVSTWLLDHNLLDQAGGQSKLTYLVGNTVSAVNIDGYTRLVLDKFHRRSLVELGNRLVGYAHEFFNPLEEIQKTVDKDLNKWRAAALDKDTKDYHLYKSLVAEVEDIEMKIEDPGLRRFKLKTLGKRHSLSPEELSNIWFKNLLYQEGCKMMAWAELVAHESEFQRWLLHGFVPFSSLVLLHAPGGMGKTRLFYDWVCCIAKGEPWSVTDEWVGFPVTSKEKRRILIVQTDETKPEMIAALKQRGFDAEMEARYITNWTTSMMPTLIKCLEEFRPELVLIDSLSSINRDSLIEENSVEYAKPVLFLRHLAGLYKCCILLTHHSNRQGDLRGSTAIQAAASMVLKLERDPKFAGIPEDGHRILEITKSRVREPKRYSVCADFLSGRWELLGERVGDRDEIDENLPLKDLLVRYLAARRNIRFCVQELAESLGRNDGSVRRAIAALANSGIISRVVVNNRCLYFLEGDEVPPPPPPDPLPPDPVTDPGSHRIAQDRQQDRLLEIPPSEHHRSFAQASDPAIAKNQKNTEEISPQIPTSAIALIEQEAETPHREELGESDGGDHPPDHEAIATDPISELHQIDWHDDRYRAELVELLMSCEGRNQLLDLSRMFPAGALLKAAKTSDGLYEQILKWLGPEEPQPRKIWDVKVGDRVRGLKHRTTGTAIEVQPWGLQVRADDRTILNWGYSDCELLPEREDPKILADKLHERIYPGCKLRIMKHPQQKGSTKKVGVVVKKSPSYSLYQRQALVRFADGQESTICLEAAELLKPKTFDRICYQRKWYGRVATINKMGELFVSWEKSTNGKPPSDPLFAEDVEVVE